MAAIPREFSKTKENLDTLQSGGEVVGQGKVKFAERSFCDKLMCKVPEIIEEEEEDNTEVLLKAIQCKHEFPSDYPGTPLKHTVDMAALVKYEFKQDVDVRQIALCMPRRRAPCRV